MTRQLAPLHRWLGLLACLALFGFALSGLMHPLMSRLQPQPSRLDAPAVSLSPQALAPATVLRRQRIEQLTRLRLVSLDDGAAYRIETGDDRVRYFAAADGRELADGEARHAERLARHASGDSHSALRDLALVTAFDRDYPAINRLLPVWRVRLDRDDGLTAYVDTRHDRLSTLQNDRKRVVQALFLHLHNYAALEELPWLRLPLMLLLLTAALVTTASGLLLFMRRRRLPGRSTRGAHRYLALVIAPTTLGFVISGGWHLLHQARQPLPPADASNRFVHTELGDWLPATAFHLARIDGIPCYRIAAATGDHAHHHHGDDDRVDIPERCLRTDTGEPLADAEPRLAEALARHHAGVTPGVPVIALQPVRHFDGDYGFASKRLPVWRVRFAGDDSRWYVETASGALAARTDGHSRGEGWSFSYLHKWQFLPWRDLRDALQILFAGAHLVVAGLGIHLFLGGFSRRSRTRPTPAAPLGEHS